MRTTLISPVLVALAAGALALPAASVASDKQVGSAVCSWNHSLTLAGDKAPKLSTASAFAAYKPKIAAYARQVIAIDATLVRSLRHASASSATGRRVRTVLLTKVVPAVDKGAQLVLQGATQVGGTKAAATAIGTGVGKIVSGALELFKVPGVYTWLPNGCLS